MEPISKIFGSNVKKYRKLNKLTQDELSEKLGVGPKHLSRIETGVQFASASLIEKIVEALNVSPATLFEHVVSKKQVISEYTDICEYIDKKMESLYERIKGDIVKHT